MRMRSFAGWPVLNSFRSRLAARARGSRDAPQRPFDAAGRVLGVAIALIMAAISVATAAITVIASDRAAQAGDAASRVLQEHAERLRIEQSIDARVAFDRRLFPLYEEHWHRHDSYHASAHDLLSADPALAALLDLRSQTESDVRDGLLSLFQVRFPDICDGKPCYPSGVEEEERNADRTLVTLAASDTQERAEASQRGAVGALLTILALVAALFVLTAAMTAAGSLRRLFGVVGVLMAFAAMAWLVSWDTETGLVVGVPFALVVGALIVATRFSARARSLLAGADDPQSADELFGPEIPGRRPAGVPIPAVEGTSKGFARWVAVLIAFATLFGALVGYLQNEAFSKSEAAAREAQRLGLQAAQALASDEQLAWARVYGYALYSKYQFAADGARQAASYFASVGDTAQAAQLEQEAAGFARLAAASTAESIDPDDPSGPVHDDGFPRTLLGQARYEAAVLLARQDAANRAGLFWGEQGGRYVAILALVAVAVYLFGLAAIFRHPRLRAVFATVAAVMVLFASGWTFDRLQAATPAGYEPGPDHAKYAEGHVARWSADRQDEFERAKQALTEAVRLDPAFARAHFELAMAAFAAGSPEAGAQGMSIVDPAALRLAIEHLREAERLGLDDPSLHTTAGFASLLLALDAAEDEEAAHLEESLTRTRRALEAAPADPLIVFNLGLSLLASGMFDDAVNVYQDGLELIEQPIVGQTPAVTGALTDLELLASKRPQFQDEIDLVKELLVISGARPAEATIEWIGPSLELIGGATLQSNFELSKSFNPQRDVVTALWYRSDPMVEGWYVLEQGSGRLRFDVQSDDVVFGTYGEDSYYLDLRYSRASWPPECLPPGEYRLELYINGRLAGEPAVLDLDQDVAYRTVWASDLGVVTCVPPGWQERSDILDDHMHHIADPPQNRGAVLMRVHMPYQDDAPRSEVVVESVLATVEREVPTVAGDLVEEEPPQPRTVFGVSDERIAWYQYPGGRLAVQSGVTDDHIVLVGVVYGPAEAWASGELNRVLDSLIYQTRGLRADD